MQAAHLLGLVERKDLDQQGRFHYRHSLRIDNFCLRIYWHFGFHPYSCWRILHRILRRKLHPKLFSHSIDTVSSIIARSDSIRQSTHGWTSLMEYECNHSKNQCRPGNRNLQRSIKAWSNHNLECSNHRECYYTRKLDSTYTEVDRSLNTFCMVGLDPGKRLRRLLESRSCFPINSRNKPLRYHRLFQRQSSHSSTMFGWL